MATINKRGHFLNYFCILNINQNLKTMKKLIFCLLLGASGCVPAKAEKPTFIHHANEWFVTMGRSADGKRIKVKYQTDFSGNICTYCEAYVWGGSSWMWASIGTDSNGQYVTYVGVKYYF